MFLKIVKFGFAFVLILFGLLLSGLTVIAILDPVGTKMADDADPFGDPYVPFWQHLIFFGIAGICFVAAYFLAWERVPRDR
jgi:hypothetical protein